VLVSYNWLKEYIKLDLSPEILADKLNMAGLAVAEIIKKEPEFDGVIVAMVIKKEKHPNASNLSLCEVDTGKEVLSIVCGAPNVDAGQIVPLALIGAHLPGGIKIKLSKIRGIESNGMICSAPELGLGADATGIMVLDHSKYKIGQEFKASDPDTIFNFEINPNRPDLLCITGIARFISSVLSLNYSMPECSLKNGNIDQNFDIDKKLRVEILDSQKCPRYTARIIVGVKVSDSPSWLKNRLIASGVRPLNNIVDITNYVMLELNQPLHAFDYTKIKGSKIIIRPANESEKIKTLDGVVYGLHSDDLIISDEKEAIAIAGVMGGENFSIFNDTRSVILESAYFNPGSVRKTSRRLGLISESSYRFERGIDLEFVNMALDRASQLISELCGGKISYNYIDLYPGKKENKKIIIPFDKVNRILGLKLEKDNIKSLISSLHFKINSQNENGTEVIVPSGRPDISQEIDIIEDIAQIYGYNKVDTTLPCSIIDTGTDTENNLFNNKISEIMVSCGFNNVVNYSFKNNKFLKYLSVDNGRLDPNPVSLKNPFNDDETHMKTTLIPDMIKCLEYNFNNENENLHLFEISNTFKSLNVNFTQSPMLAAISSGFIMEPSFNHNQLKSDFYYLKHIIESLYSITNTDCYLKFESPLEFPVFFEYASEIQIGEEKIGFIGQLSREIMHTCKFKDNVFLFEISLNALKKFIDVNNKYRKISYFPTVKRDLSILVGESISEIQIENIIKKEHRSLIKSIKLYDLYKGQQVPVGCKSLTYSIIFQSDKKTLSEIEINKVMERIVGNLEKEISAELRS